MSCISGAKGTHNGKQSARQLPATPFFDNSSGQGRLIENFTEKTKRRQLPCARGQCNATPPLPTSPSRKASADIRADSAESAGKSDSMRIGNNNRSVQDEEIKVLLEAFVSALERLSAQRETLLAVRGGPFQPWQKKKMVKKIFGARLVKRSFEYEFGKPLLE